LQNLQGSSAKDPPSRSAHRREVRVIPESEKGIGFSGVADGRAAPDNVEDSARGHLRGFQRSLRPGVVGTKQRENKDEQRGNARAKGFHGISPESCFLKAAI